MSNLKDKIKEIINIEKKLIIAGMKYLNILNKYDKLIITDNKYYIAKNIELYNTNFNKILSKYRKLIIEIYPHINKENSNFISGGSLKNFTDLIKIIKNLFSFIIGYNTAYVILSDETNLDNKIILSKIKQIATDGKNLVGLVETILFYTIGDELIFKRF